MAKEKKKSTVSLVEEMAEPVAEKNGLKLWDVRFEKEGSLWYLRIFIDKEGGVSIEDCERQTPLNRAIFSRSAPQGWSGSW